jgi:hypothetical protein
MTSEISCGAHLPKDHRPIKARDASSFAPHRSGTSFCLRNAQFSVKLICQSQFMSLNLKEERDRARPAFDRKRVFAGVEKSNHRFEKYSKVQRRAFAAKAGALSVLAPANEPNRRA